MKPRISRLFFVMLLIVLFALCLLFLALNKKKAQVELTQCTNQMALIVKEAIRWKAAHHDQYPTNFTFLSSSGEPRLLVCPSDKSNRLLEAIGWPKTNIEAVSTYEWIVPSRANSQGATNPTLIRCKIHFLATQASGQTSRETDPEH